MNRRWFGLVLSALWLATRAAVAQPVDVRSNDDDLARRLEQEARLPWIEQAALARHPALRESHSRVMAVSERASGANRLPDPEFKYEQWAVPLNQPYALNRANTLMFGLRQSIPAPGTRDARARVAAEDAHITADEQRALERDLLLRVRRAYFDYYAADRALQVHLEHVKVAEQIVAQVRSSYAVGQSSQQDLLKVLVELSRLHNDLADIRQQYESARLMLNSLMAQPPEAPLGRPADLPRPPVALDVKELDRARATERPELAAAQSAIRRSEATLHGAKAAARWPSFMVGADYWLMPTQTMSNAYGAMVSMSLPWLSSGHRADVREAERTVDAERRAAEAIETTTVFELHDAVARLQAANTSLEVIENDLVPQAEKSLEAAKASYSVGQTGILPLLDSLRSYFQVRLEHSRALSRVMAQVANVEFASGARLISAPASETAK